MKTFLAAFSFLLLTTQSAVAQAAPQSAIPQLGESIEVSIVNVDVHVTDKKGNRVRGLTKDDFEIYEAGKLQPISNFAEYSSIVDRSTAGVDGPSVDRTAPRQKRTIAVFLERMQLADFQIKPLVGAIKDVLRKSVEPGDVVSIVIWDRFRPLHVGFTEDLAPIEEALDAFARDAGKARFDEVALQRADMLALAEFEARVAAMAARADGGFGGSRGGAGGSASSGGMKTPEGAAGTPGTSATLPMLRAYIEMKMRVAAITSLLDTMGSGSDSRKILLLGTRRLGAVAGAEFAFMSGAPYVATEAHERWSTASLMQSLVDTANASGVTLYPVYPPGLTTTMEDASSNPMMPTGGENTNGIPPGGDDRTLQNETINLQRIAQKTGGLAAWGIKDVVKLLPQINGDLNDYYSLAYRVTSSRQDLSRDITVRAKNRDYTVRARQQFVEKSDTSRMETASPPPSSARTASRPSPSPRSWASARPSPAASLCRSR